MAEETVTLSRRAYDQLLAEIENLRDSLELAQAKREDDGTRVPGEIVGHLVEGDHPVAAWRKYRGWTVANLAHRTGLAESDITAIETRATPGTVPALRALSDALDAPVDLLIETET